MVIMIVMTILVMVVLTMLRGNMRTQNKENYYYFFWVIAMVAFIAPQVMTAIAYHKLADILSKPIQVELVSPLKFRL